MPALCSILNSAYYANNYAGIFDAGLDTTFERSYWLSLLNNHFDGSKTQNMIPSFKKSLKHYRFIAVIDVHGINA